ncbi:MAG: molybdopterin cofactor-binding domain-containing protein [Oxalobacteraceae bacterium]
MFEPVSSSAHRRHFLLGGAAVAGAWLGGWSFLPPRQRLVGDTPLSGRETDVALNGWVMVGKDNVVSVMLAKNEMGQGVMTALAMLVAEELDVPLSMVRVLAAPIDKIYGDTTMLADGLPFHPEDQSAMRHLGHWLSRKLAREIGVIATGGSSSVRDSWLPMREAGAEARARLISAAAIRWGVPASECETAHGKVKHARGLVATYGDLAADAAELSSPGFQLKPASSFRLIGKDIPRLDVPEKSDGTARFGMDIRPKGLVYAAVMMCPVFGGKLVSVDTREANDQPGVLRVVKLAADRSGAPDAVAVIAGSWWTAQSALALLTPEWDEGQQASLSTESLMEQLSDHLTHASGTTLHSVGDGVDPDDLPQAIQADYSAPYLPHLPMEPLNCTAQLIDDRLRLWLPTQVPSIAVSTAARVADISEDQVDLQATLIGSGFGRRLDTDMVAQAVALAKEMPGVPVQLVWRREDDIAHDFYRPASVARLTGVLGTEHKIKSLHIKSASAAPIQQLLHRAFGLPMAGPDKTAAEGLFDHPYEIPNQQIEHVIAEVPVPVGPWRSVGHSHHAFFKESFIDEMAHAASIDSVQFRRDLLSAHARHLAVLNKAVVRAGKVPGGRAHGVALHDCYGSIVAQVAEVGIEEGRVRVHKVVCAIDCGLVVNPDIVRQQMESGIAFGLSAALHGDLKIAQGRVKQKNFHDAPILRIDEMPDVEVIIIDSDASPGGVGEAGTPPIAPAVANAVFKLTGKRLRSLPLRL